MVVIPEENKCPGFNRGAGGIVIFVLLKKSLNTGLPAFDPVINVRLLCFAILEIIILLQMKIFNLQEGILYVCPQ